MHSTRRLLQHSLRLTLFTRENCSLCVDAKNVLSRVSARRPFDLREIDVMKPGQAKWKDLYEYDAPVVHIDRANTETSAAAKKLMHRFTEDQLEQLMNSVEKSP